MLEIITINKTDLQNDKTWKNLLIESYNAYHLKNDLELAIEDSTSLDDFWTYLKTEEVCIVLRNNKFIGFFVNKYHKANNEISFLLFAHPNACPMSLRSLTRASVFRTIMIIAEEPQYYNFEFVTWHPSIVSVIKNFIPDIKINMINSNYIICYSHMSKLKTKTLLNNLSKYLDKHQNINKNNYKIVL